MGDFLKRWTKAKGGAAAMIFAIGGVAMVMCVGAGVDLSRQAYLRSRLSDAVDAAALGLIGKTSPEFLQASTMNGDGPLSGGKNDAWAIFKATMSDQVDATVDQNSDFVVVAQKTGRAVTASVTATAHIPTYFMGMVGTQTMSVTSHAAVENDLPSYMDFYLLLDNTPSMGMGSSQTDMNTLSNANGGCAFACHIAGSKTDAYSLARSLGVSMRIDSVRQATQQLMDTASSTETMPNQFRMSIATFGYHVGSTGYTPIFPANPQVPSADLAAAKTAAGAIDLMDTPAQNYDDDRATTLAYQMTGANAVISAPGDGTSTNTPLKTLFVVTDGVNDGIYTGSCTNGVMPDGSRCLSPIDTSLCDPIKKRGIQIAILYTTYLPSDGWYWGHVSPFQDQISPTLQSCASPGLFFEVNPATSGITNAMNTLFVRAVEQARLIS